MISEKQTNRGRSFALDLVRSVAIWLVLVAHLVKQLHFAGFFGVELFFSLSGFLIGRILLRSYLENDSWGCEQLMNFWQRRWWRTLPNYYLFLILYLVIHAAWGDSQSAGQIISYLWFGQSLLNSVPSFFSVSWSLCIEEWFYLLFPIPLLLFSGSYKAKLIYFWCVVAFFIVLFGLFKFLYSMNYPGTVMRGITLLRLDAIGCGVLLASIGSIDTFKKLSVQSLVAIGCLPLLAGCLFCINHAEGWRSLYTATMPLILFPFGFSWIVFAASRVKWNALKYPALHWLVFQTSQLSYSIYLVHVPCIWFSYWLLDSFRDSSLGNVLSKALAVMLSYSVSAVVFYYFESRMTKFRPRELQAKKPSPDLLNLA